MQNDNEQNIFEPALKALGSFLKWILIALAAGAVIGIVGA